MQISNRLSVDRLLVFGGPYSNLAATDAVLKKADELGYSAGEILCTGDIVAYCAEPAETIDLIRSRNIAVVMGNCEESLAAGNDDCGCGFEEGTACDLLSAQWYNFSKKHVRPDQVNWMATLPRQIPVEIAGKRFVATHATLSSINDFVFPSTDKRLQFSEMGTSGIDGVICGHSGIPFIEEREGLIWVNAGVVGMPANDGTPRTWYTIFEIEDGALKISVESLEYDYSKTVSVMDERGLKNGYRDCLNTGLWPSMDVLPKKEREQVGEPLKPLEIKQAASLSPYKLAAQ